MNERKKVCRSMHANKKHSLIWSTRLSKRWTYEFCYGETIRQLHEGEKLDLKTGLPSRYIESQHLLGSFTEDLDEFPNEEETEYVVNLSKGIRGKKAGEVVDRTLGARSGNGAYFVQEYTGGDVCDHTDVTDSAVKSGKVGEGHLERATTVRFFCGQELQLVSINEDSTCHYVVDVVIPDLCHHPLFKAPVPKKTVVKCLPAEDEY